MGINVIYSGTVAYRYRGAFLGLPSIAMSQYLKADIPIDYARSAAERAGGDPPASGAPGIARRGGSRYW